MNTHPKLRKGVCAIILGPDSKVLLGERAHDPDQWQLPQGGIDSHETPLQALHREVAEEVGVQGLPVLKQTKEFISYLWPTERFRDSKYRGQKHFYFLLNGQDLDIQSLTATAEFARFTWSSPAEAIERVVAWRKPAYEQAFHELGLLRE